MAKQGISVSFRLHPSDAKERQAIAIIQEWVAQGFEIRQMMTAAILNSEGYTPDMFRGGDEKLTPSLMEAILTDFLKEIKANGGVVATSHSDKEIEFDEDEDVDTERNIAAAYLARSKRK